MKTRIITTLENTGITEEDKLYIVHREVTAEITEDYIAYNKTGSTETKVGINKKNPHKSIYCSELVQKMIRKDWLNPKRIFIVEDKKIGKDFDIRKLIKNTKQALPIYTVIPPIEKEQEKESILLTTPNDLTDYEFNKLWDLIFDNIEDGDNIKKQIEDMAINGEFYLYDTSKETYDLLNSSNTVTLIEVGSDIYTNSLDIKPILFNTVIDNNTTAKIDLSIQYSKVGDNSTIYSSDTTFNGFSIITSSNNNTSIKFNDVFQTINDDVVIEFVDGIIRLFPKNENILECIISNCTITYGNLKY